MQSATYNQTRYRGRNDDGGEASATWKAAVDTAYPINPSLSQSHRLRIGVREETGASDNNTAFRLQYSKNGGAWTDVTTSSSNVQAASSSNVSDGTQTTQQITSSTFAGGELAVGDAVAGDNTGIDFSGLDVAEVEFSITVVSADVVQDDTIELRVVFDGGTVLSTYNSLATINVAYDQTAAADAASASAGASDPTAQETRAIGGTCTLNGSGVGGAVVRVVDSDSNEVAETVTTAGDGSWSAVVPTSATYHAVSSYDDGTDRYNAKSNPYLL